MRRWAGGIDNSVAALKKGDDKVRQGIDEMAAGTPLHATTPAREAESVGQKILSTARNATREDAKHAAQGVLDAAAAWLKKPWQQKLGDAVESVGDAMASPTTYIPAAGVLRRGEIAVDAIEDAAKAGKTGRRVSKAAAAAEHKTSPITTLPSRYGHLSDHPSVDAGKDYTRAQKRKIFEENMRRGGGSLKSDASGDVLVSPREHERGVTPPSNEAHVDHVQPKAHGGTNSFQNAQVLSRDENLKKDTK
jgi:5-methylcytosine-specific restriction endonuclease McrA